MREKKEVIKHSAAVHIQNNITLLQRRAWNVLLANAYDDLPHQDEYQIRVPDLVYILEFDSKNEEYLKEALRALTTCALEWNVLGKDGYEEWGVTTLLAAAKIKNGVCTYAYSPELRRRLYNPRMYARISLSMQNKFASKHAQALWELCVDYLHDTTHYGETPFIPLPSYRKLMGVADELYPLFKLFNTRVIKEPVAEINKVTDFQVNVEYQRRHRKVAAVKFKAQRTLHVPEPAQRALPLFPDLEDMPVVVKELKDAGFAAREAWEIWQKGFEYVHSSARPDIEGDPETAFAHYIREKIDLLTRQQAKGKLHSRTGFLLNAIKKNYANPAFAEVEQQKRGQQERQAKEQRQRQRQWLEDNKAQLEKSRRADLHTLCKDLIAHHPALAEEALAAVLEQESSYKKHLHPGKTAAENYRDAILLWMFVDEWLEAHYPEHFETIRTTYDASLTDTNSKLDTFATGA